MITIWVEIPAISLERAKTFYEAVFEHAPTEIIDDGTRRITILPGTPSVSLNETRGFVPTSEGSLPYFHLEDPLGVVVDRVVAAGGGVVEPVAQRGENGFFALVLDSEGNGLTLHSARP
jgi:predicted enzyme related to lactoylglutathione lyase